MVPTIQSIVTFPTPDFYEFNMIWGSTMTSDHNCCHCLPCRMAWNRVIMSFLLCFHSKAPWSWPLLPHKGFCSFLWLPRKHMKTNSWFTNIFPASSIECPFTSWPHLKMNCSCSSCGFYLVALLHWMDPHSHCLLLNLFCSFVMIPRKNLWTSEPLNEGKLGACSWRAGCSGRPEGNENSIFISQ